VPFRHQNGKSSSISSPSSPLPIPSVFSSSFLSGSSFPISFTSNPIVSNARSCSSSSASYTSPSYFESSNLSGALLKFSSCFSVRSSSINGNGIKLAVVLRSEERRVGKECAYGGGPAHEEHTR